MTELPATLLDQAAAALAAEIAYARANRRPVFTIPAEDLVARLITAAWPILADPAHREKEPS